jgi:hypothetical protein
MRFSGLFFGQNGYISRLLVFNVSRRGRIFIDVGIASMLTCDTTVIYFLKENIYIYEYLHACLDVIQLVNVKHLQKSSRQGRGRDVSAHIHITMVNKYIYPHSVGVWILQQYPSNEEKLPCWASPIHTC